MAWGTIVQSKTGGTAQGGASTLTVTMDSAITEGNLLLAAAATRAASMTTPTGWSVGQAKLDTTRTDALYIYYKIAGSSESTSVLFDDSTSNQVIVADVWEVEGPWNASPYDTGNGNLNSPTAVDPATISTGASGTFSQADVFVMAAHCWRNDSGGLDVLSSSVDSSFTERQDASGVYADYTGNLFPTHLLTSWRMPGATTSLNVTGSFYCSSADSSTDAMIGVIAGFKKSAASTVNIPAVIHHMRQQGIL